MIVAGIDLATQPAGTAGCLLDWGTREVLDVRVGLNDHAITAMHARADITAIDAPLGWPVGFARLVGRYAQGEPWPPEPPVLDLWFRATDRAAVERGAGRPLSVSSDKLARAAERAVRLLTRLGAPEAPLPRAGGRVVEVYPAGTLRRWGIPVLDDAGRRVSYKSGAGAAAARARILGHLVADGRLRIRDVDATRLVATDDALDALVAALAGVAAALGAAFAPRPGEEARLAPLEGWLWLPDRPLAELPDGAT